MRVASLLNSGADVESRNHDDGVCYIPSMNVCSSNYVLSSEFRVSITVHIMLD